GYSKDAFNVYYYGEKLNDASASSFKVDDDGYAHDAFSMYYYGKKIK
ncbi:MAG: DKNYY domain-containing protein, partial [Prevotella sp.]|nr:DKNYY domain-containing protein [Prevotella sp.]